LANLAGLAGNFVFVFGVTGGASTQIDFNTGGLPYVAGSSLSLLFFDSATGESSVMGAAITEQQWSEGVVIIATATPAVDTVCAYAYSADKKKCSNIYVQEL
jgi:hypothetical protein